MYKDRKEQSRSEMKQQLKDFSEDDMLLAIHKKNLCMIFQITDKTHLFIH